MRHSKEAQEIVSKAREAGDKLKIKLETDGKSLSMIVY